MQEKVTVNRSENAMKVILRILAYALILASWFGIAAALWSFVNSLEYYGIFDRRVFIDAGLGYYGLLSFGIASSAVILAVKGGLKSNKSIFRIFKITLLVSMFFIVPMLLSMVIFLFNSI